MSELETLAIIDHLYTTFLLGDLEAALDLVSDDTLWIVYGPAELPFAGEFSGPSGVKRFLEALVTTQREVKVRSRSESYKETELSLPAFIPRL